MDNNNELDEDSVIIIGLYYQYQQLRSYQIQKVLEEMNKYKEQILIYSSKIYGFLNKLYCLLPHDNDKLKKKSAKNKWIKIYFSNFKMQYMIHEDYCTYIIYNKIPTPNHQYHQPLQEDILSEFQDQILDYIQKINQRFFENLCQNNQYSQNNMQFQLDNFEYYQMIENLYYNSDDVLTSQEYQDIEEYMRKTAQQIIKYEFEKIADQIKNSYKDFISNTEIQPNQYPQEFNYKNYGDGLKAVKHMEDKQFKVQQIQENQDISELQIGVYYIQIKKSMIILEIKKDQKNAYIINYFHHYQNKSSIFQKLSYFQIWRIKTIKLSIEETYALIKTKKKSSDFNQQQNNIIEIYEQQVFEEINNQLEQFNNLQQNIKNYISKIIPYSTNYKDIYSLKFIQQLQQKNNFDFNLIQIIEFDQNLEKLLFETQSQNVILKNKENIAFGAVIYPNQNQIIVYLKNDSNIFIDGLEYSQQKNYYRGINMKESRFNKYNQEKSDFQLKINQKEQDQKQIIIYFTNIKDISAQVAQFYVSLLLKKPEFKVLKMIKNFFELKPQNDISQQQIDQALLRLNALLKDEPPKIEKQKFKKPILNNSEDASIIVTSQPNYTSQTKMTSEQINHFVERMNDKYKQTQNKIIEQRKDQIYSPIKVNEKSQSILKQKIQNGEYQSLYERSKIRQIEKQEKIKENEKQKILEEMMSIKIKQSESKSVDNFIQKMDYWKEKRTQNIQNQQQEKIEKELEGVTFKPNLNSLSEKIIKKQNRDNDVLERFQKSNLNKQMNEQKLLMDELKKTPFTPKLNKNSVLINNQVQKQQLKNHNYFIKQQTVKQQRDSIIINSTNQKQISKETYNSKQSKSLTPDHVNSKYSTKKIKDDNQIRQRSTTPLKQNKIIPNVQEIKYNPNLKFLMTLAQKELNYSSLF
ncbi:unnamed protein product [Paramecium primaurelia]|uniref:Uncharacterized protein n=1 Tax=Paramecium primaurelia TaxID=5886 RepID=A0A8S1Q160_PARPR|nr:unnamed protein product [Paramecium primaurelia]